MATPSEVLTDRFKATENTEAAKYAALIALYFQSRVNVEDPASIEAWLNLMVPRLVRASDSSADRATQFFAAIRAIEAPGADPFRATPVKGAIDTGVRKSLLTVGPYAYTNKATKISRLDVSPAQQSALLRQAKQESTKALAAATMRHAQAGGRQTIQGAAEEDRVALGWVRVTKADPCFFCAMLASRGLNYRAFKEGAFDATDPRYVGEGDAKVHDNCGCGLKPVYREGDPLLGRTQKFADMWSMWGAGGGDAALRFRRGYEHFQKTGQYLTWDQVQSPS